MVGKDRVDRLKALFERNSCEKVFHGYENFYGNIPTPKRMLEVGVFRGESLRVWRQFWPHSQIVVMDTFQRIEPKNIRGLASVQWHRHDSREPFGPDNFDLIIDDGDHRPASQAATFRNLIGNLSPGGRYVIEDVWPWDRLSDTDKVNPWALKIGVCEESWLDLMDAIGDHKFRIYDFRRRRHPDSCLIEVSKLG